MKGTISYRVKRRLGDKQSLELTLCCEDEASAVEKRSLAQRRRARIVRLINEASRQGGRLTYNDLSLLLLSSKATIKRDLKMIKQERP